MPKIDVADGLLERFLGRPIDDAELEPLLSCAKAVLDERDLDAGIRRIELNDTNRPDLWSTAGLARQLRARLGEPLPSYRLLFRAGVPPPLAGTRHRGRRGAEVGTALHRRLPGERAPRWARPCWST